MPSQARSLGQVTRATEYLLCCPLFWRKSQGQVLSVSLSPQPSGSPRTLAFGEGQKEVKSGGPTATGKYLVNGVQPGGGKVKGQLQNWVSTLCKTDRVNRINMAKQMGNWSPERPSGRHTKGPPTSILQLAFTLPLLITVML